MPLILPKRRVAAPAKPPPGSPLNQAHPLAQGLRLFYPINEGGGQKLTNAARPDETISADGLIWAPGRRLGYQTVRFDGSTSDGQSDKPLSYNTNVRDLTIALLIDFRAVPSSDLVILEVTTNFNLSAGAFIVVASSTGTVSFLKRMGVSGVGDGYNSGDVAAIADGLHLYTARFPNGGNTTVHVDGNANSATNGNTGTNPTQFGLGDNTQTLYMGSRARGSLFFNEGLGGFWVWQRLLSDAEIRRHALEPFAMLGVPRPFMLVVPSTATNHALTATSSGIGSATGNLLEADHILGTSSGIGSQTGTLRNAKPLTGTSAGTGAATGNLLEADHFSGTSPGVGGASASLRVVKQLTATSSGIGGTVPASLRNLKSLTVISPGVGGATGNLLESDTIIGTSSGIGGQSGRVIVWRPLSGTSGGVGNQTGLLTDAVPVVPANLPVGVLIWDQEREPSIAWSARQDPSISWG